MEVIWRTVDQRGNPVALTDEGWQHIIGYHVELASQQELIRATLETPTFINSDVNHASRSNFYRIVADAEATHPKYLKVCVEYETTDGTIVTAYLTRRVKTKEEREWP